MNDQTADLLLQEFRDFRKDIAEWKQDAGERVATLEAQMKDLCGNGQPGRMTIAERAIGSLQRFRWWQLGAGAGISGIVTVLGWVLVQASRH